jgi:hypothetical protein
LENARENEGKSSGRSPCVLSYNQSRSLDLRTKNSNLELRHIVPLGCSKEYLYLHLPYVVGPWLSCLPLLAKTLLKQKCDTLRSLSNKIKTSLRHHVRTTNNFQNLGVYAHCYRDHELNYPSYLSGGAANRLGPPLQGDSVVDDLLSEGRADLGASKPRPTCRSTQRLHQFLLPHLFHHP